MAVVRGASLACAACLLAACSALDLGGFEVTCVEEEVCNGRDDDCDGEVDEGLDWRAVDPREHVPADRVAGPVLDVDHLVLGDARALLTITRGARAGDYATEALFYTGAKGLRAKTVSIYRAAEEPPLGVESGEHPCGYRAGKLGAVANARAGSLLVRAALETTGCCGDGQLVLGATHLDEDDPLLEARPGDHMLFSRDCSGDESLAPWLFAPASPRAACDDLACSAPGAASVTPPVLAALPLAQRHAATALVMWRQADGRLLGLRLAVRPRPEPRADPPLLQVRAVGEAQSLGHALAQPALVAWRGDTAASDRFIAAYPSARDSCRGRLELLAIGPAGTGEPLATQRRCLHLPVDSSVALTTGTAASAGDIAAPSRGLAAAWRAGGAAWLGPLVLDQSGGFEPAAEPIQLRSEGARVIGTPAVVHGAEGFRSARDHETIGGWIVAWIERGPPRRVMAQRVAQADAVPIGEPFELIVARKSSVLDQLWLSPAGREGGEAAALFGVLEGPQGQTLHIGTASCNDS